MNIKNIFAPVKKKKQKFEKDSILNIGVIATTLINEHVYVIPDTSSTSLKSIFSVHMKKKTFNFHTNIKHDLENKVYYFSSFLGFIDHQNTFMVFADKV